MSLKTPWAVLRLIWTTGVACKTFLRELLFNVIICPVGIVLVVTIVRKWIGVPSPAIRLTLMCAATSGAAVLIGYWVVRSYQYRGRYVLEIPHPLLGAWELLEFISDVINRPFWPRFMIAVMGTAAFYTMRLMPPEGTVITFALFLLVLRILFPRHAE